MMQQMQKQIEEMQKQLSGQTPAGSSTGASINGHYFSFKTGGDPNNVVDRFEARQQGDLVTYFRNGPVGSKMRVYSATAKPMESYSINGNKLIGPVTGTIKPNGDIEYSHGYTSRKEGFIQDLSQVQVTVPTMGHFAPSAPAVIAPMMAVPMGTAVEAQPPPHYHQRAQAQPA